MTDKLQAQSIGVLILAAGRGKRFGGKDKRQEAMADGRTLLETTLASIPDSLTRRVVVLRESDTDLARQIPDTWMTCMAADADKGMGHSLAAGIKTISNWPGVLIGLGDMPFIKDDTWRSLQIALCHYAGVVPVQGGRQGNPVGFRQCFYKEISELGGDRGAKGLIQRHTALFQTMPCDDPGILQDIDVPGDLAPG